jgi:hypothetical protein
VVGAVAVVALVREAAPAGPVVRPPSGATTPGPTRAGPTPTGPAPLATEEGARFTLAFPPDPRSLRVPGAGYFGWALLDRRTGRTTGSANASTSANTVESMIKPWIVADYLRREASAGRQPSAETLRELTLTIVDSNDPLAEKYYRLGGSDSLVRRLRTQCGLTRLGIEPTLWGMTTMSPLDAVRYGRCLADGRAAGPQWTNWVLDTMRAVRGSVRAQVSGAVQGGRWGIIDGLPPELARETAIKNGWTSYVDGWHVNCLAVHRDWVLSVLLRMPAGLIAAAEGCERIAARLVAPRS